MFSNFLHIVHLQRGFDGRKQIFHQVAHLPKSDLCTCTALENGKRQGIGFFVTNVEDHQTFGHTSIHFGNFKSKMAAEKKKTKITVRPQAELRGEAGGRAVSTTAVRPRAAAATDPLGPIQTLNCDPNYDSFVYTYYELFSIFDIFVDFFLTFPLIPAVSFAFSFSDTTVPQERIEIFRLIHLLFAIFHAFRTSALILVFFQKIPAADPRAVSPRSFHFRPRLSPLFPIKNTKTIKSKKMRISYIGHQRVPPLIFTFFHTNFIWILQIFASPLGLPTSPY